MAKILILGKPTDKKKRLSELLLKNFQDPKTEVVLGDPSQVKISLAQGKIGIEIAGENIRNYDLVYLRGVSGENIFTATTIAICLEKLSVKFFDRLYAGAGPHRTKLGSLALLAGENLPVPKTVFYADKKPSDHFRELSRILGLPFVAKEMSLQRGKGVHLINKIDDLKTLPEKSAGGSLNEYFFQEFIEKDHEYRILVLGNKVGVWEEKIAGQAGQFRYNVALGAKEIFFKADQIPAGLEEVAVKAAKALNIQIAGVDLMLERKTGRVYLLEVNRGPGLTYEENVSPEFKALAEFLEREAK